MLGSSGYVPGLFPPDHHAFLACGSLRPPSCQFRLKGTACPRLSPAVGQDGHLLPCLPHLCHSLFLSPISSLSQLS